MSRDSKHAKTSDFSRQLCDELLGCLPAGPGTRRNPAASLCGVYVHGTRAALCWVYHSSDHLRIYLYCKDTPETRTRLERSLPKGVALQARPYPRKGMAQSTPLFFEIHNEDQARALGPVLLLLSSEQLTPKIRIRNGVASDWQPNSESNAATIEELFEGSAKTATVIKYERKSANRRKCILHYKPICAVCGFDFERFYGLIGKGYIHVHHLEQLASLMGKGKAIDPIRDLRPVCPNCHDMLHARTPPFTIEELQLIIVQARGAN